MQGWSIEPFDFARNGYMGIDKDKNIGTCLKNA
jgi:hypothetical protein